MKIFELAQLNSSRAGYALAAGLMVACGADTDKPDWQMAQDAGGTSVADDAGRAPLDVADDGASVDDATGIGFSIVVPGAPEPVPARVSSRTSSAIEVLSYPETLSLPVTYGALPVGYEGAFSDEFCEGVRSIASLANSGGVSKDEIKNTLRRQGTVTAGITLSSLVGPEFLAKSLAAARAAGASNAARIANPLLLGQASINLELSSNAISNVLGDTDALLKSITDGLARQASTAYETGVVSVSIAAKDLWCDLAQKNATLHIQVMGEIQGEESSEYGGETLLTGVLPM